MDHTREGVTYGLAGLTALLACTISTGANAGQFETVAEAIEQARERLASPAYSRSGMLVLSFSFDWEPAERAQVELESSSWRRCICVRSTGSVLVEPIRPGRNHAVRVRAPGYHESRREFTVGEGEIVVIDDLVLEAVADGTGAALFGTIWLEDDADPSGITVRAADMEATTDADGEFHMFGLPSGIAHVWTCLQGYTGLSARVEFERGQRASVALEGYQKRAALVRWAWQPEPGRDLEYGLQTGVSILRPCELDRVSFEKGFKQVSGSSDFLVRQREDRLIIRNFDLNGQGPGFVRLRGVGFDDVLQAPDIEYKTQRGEKELHEGAVFVFQCYDNEHYAKMDVLQILRGEHEYERAISDLARQPLE